MVIPVRMVRNLRLRMVAMPRVSAVVKSPVLDVAAWLVSALPERSSSRLVLNFPYTTDMTSRLSSIMPKAITIMSG